MTDDVPFLRDVKSKETLQMLEYANYLNLFCLYFDEDAKAYTLTIKMTLISQ